MRQSIKFLLVFIISSGLTFPSYAAIKGSLEYKIPIDYSKIDQQELEAEAETMFNRAVQNSKGKVDEDMTAALNMYTILSNSDPENVIYAVRLGKLYDLIRKDRYAKGNYYRAMGIDTERPEAYYYLGEYYYSRAQYRRALKMYERAYEHGYQGNFFNNSRLREIYRKFGDSEGFSRLKSKNSGEEAL